MCTIQVQIAVPAHNDLDYGFDTGWIQTFKSQSNTMFIG